jgi:hypothetical protein
MLDSTEALRQPLLYSRRPSQTWLADEIEYSIPLGIAICPPRHTGLGSASVANLSLAPNKIVAETGGTGEQA